MAQSSLHVDNIHKRFGDREVLRGISLAAQLALIAREPVFSRDGRAQRRGRQCRRPSSAAQLDRLIAGLDDVPKSVNTLSFHVFFGRIEDPALADLRARASSCFDAHCSNASSSAPLGSTGGGQPRSRRSTRATSTFPATRCSWAMQEHARISLMNALCPRGDSCQRLA